MNPTEYVFIAYSDAWGECISEEEHAAACERAEEWLTEHEGDDLCIYCRPPYDGECTGVYRVLSNGDLQILGYSLPAPGEVCDLINKAWEHACSTWPE